MPVVADSKGQEKANGGCFDDGAEIFMVVDAFVLKKTFSNKASFVLVRDVIRGGLEFVYPFTSDDGTIERSRDKLPCLIA